MTERGGRGDAPDARAELFLVAADGKKISIGHTTQADLKAGHSLGTNLVGTIPATLPKGTYDVEVRAKLRDGVTQYSEHNDAITAGVKDGMGLGESIGRVIAEGFFPHKHASPPQVYKQRTRPCSGVEVLSSRHFLDELQ